MFKSAGSKEPKLARDRVSILERQLSMIPAGDIESYVNQLLGNFRIST